ncbi:MAG: filamentous hemagglutinin N-terminal domain-containing protein [Gammaproteobacteria bacterium]|nr:filamentous hemagglutinin N-terminal domain-containing protein [Gammaproteobacteria bacterium]
MNFYRFIIPFFFSIPFALSLRAEVILDGTLGKKGPIQGPDFAIEARLGVQKDANLFHSFQAFNLDSHERAVFFGPDSVENVISRVTGGEASRINGLLGSAIPDADLYFINPAGVLFGPDARLNVQGSFRVSTADYLELGETGNFNAARAELSVLTTAPPSAFGFLSESPASISKERSRLAVRPGKTLSLIGGELRIEDKQAPDQEVFSYLAAPGGRIDLVSLASPGKVPVNPDAMADDASRKFGAVTIRDTTSGMDNFYRDIANVDASGAGGGKIYIRAGRIILDNGYVFADTLGEQDGQGITVKAADELTLINGARITSDVFENKIFEKTTGNAGNINLTAKRIILADGSQAGSTSRAPGRGGDISIKAKESVEMSGGLTIDDISFSSGFFSNTRKTGTGGQISISTPALTMKDKAVIRAETLGFGDAGDVSVEVDTLTMEGGAQIVVNTGKQVFYQEELDAIHGTGRGGKLTLVAKESVRISGQANEERWSGLYNNVFTAGEGGVTYVSAPFVEIWDNSAIQSNTRGSGNAGHIVMETDQLSIYSRGAISTDTNTGNGHAGNITIKASEAISAAEPNSSVRGNISSAALSRGHGDAGKITVTTPQLTLQKAGQIHSAAEGTGRGGEIEIHTDNLTLDGSAKIDAGTLGPGQGGEINIEAKHIRLRENSAISANSEDRGNAGNMALKAAESLHMQNAAINTSTRQADGGNIKVVSPGILSMVNSEIATAVNGDTGGGGNIELDIGQRVYLFNSRMTASVQGGAGDGGNLSAGSETEFVVLRNNSRMTARAYGGKGGNISINAGHYIASFDSIVDASSKLGIDGIVRINAPDEDAGEGLVLPPANFLKKEDVSVQQCEPRSVRESSRFVIGPLKDLPVPPDDLNTVEP